jgi:hypothetical protein
VVCERESPCVGAKRTCLLHKMIFRVVQIQRPVPQHDFIAGVNFPSGAKIATRRRGFKPAAHEELSSILLPRMKANTSHCQMTLITVWTEVAVGKFLGETVVLIAVARCESQPRCSPLPDYFRALAVANVFVGVVLPRPLHVDLPTRWRLDRENLPTLRRKSVLRSFRVRDDRNARKGRAQH